MWLKLIFPPTPTFLFFYLRLLENWKLRIWPTYLVGGHCVRIQCVFTLWGFSWEKHTLYSCIQWLFCYCFWDSLASCYVAQCSFELPPSFLSILSAGIIGAYHPPGSTTMCTMSFHYSTTLNSTEWQCSDASPLSWLALSCKLRVLSTFSQAIGHSHIFFGEISI